MSVNVIIDLNCVILILLYNNLVKKILKATDDKNITVKFLSSNLIDHVWTSDRPPLPLDHVRVHDMIYAGQSISGNYLHVYNDLYHCT